LNEIHLRAWFQRWAISQRGGFTFTDLKANLPKELDHPRKVSKLINDAQRNCWLFEARRGRGKINLDSDAQGSKLDLGNNRPRFWLSHPRYYTRGRQLAIIRANVLRSMQILRKEAFCDWARMIQASVSALVYPKIAEQVTGPLLDATKRQTSMESSLSL